MGNRSGVNGESIASGSATVPLDERAKTICVNCRRGILDSSEPARHFIAQETVRNGGSAGSPWAGILLGSFSGRESGACGGDVFSVVVIGSPERKGRIRSAERTEVHLVANNSCSRTHFLPINADPGIRKEVRHAGKTPPIESQPRSSQVSSEGLAQGAYRSHSRSSPADQGISSSFRPGDGRRDIQRSAKPW